MFGLTSEGGGGGWRCLGSESKPNLNNPKDEEEETAAAATALKSHLCANLSRRRLIDDMKRRVAQANLGCHFPELLASVQAFQV